MIGTELTWTGVGGSLSSPSAMMRRLPAPKEGAVPIEPTVIGLDSDASPGQVLRALAGEPDLVCLWGDGWGSTVITSRPLERSATVDRLGEPGPPWFGWLGYDRP